MLANLFWLSDEEWARIEPLLPTDVRGKSRVDDSGELRTLLSDRGTKAVIPNRSNRKKKFRFSKKRYRERHKVENAFCRLKDFRRIATRYDKLEVIFAAAVYLVAAVIWWT
jgi:transposase